MNVLVPKCPYCGHSKTRLVQVDPADASIKQYDEVRLWRCDPKGGCGSTFTQTRNPPEQNLHHELKYDPAGEAKDALVHGVTELLGHDIPNLRWVLRALSHPDLIEHTKKYFNAMDKASMCTKYETPWSCAKEAEAKYENIKYGWLGAGSGVGFSEWWCDNCKKKVME